MIGIIAWFIERIQGRLEARGQARQQAERDRRAREWTVVIK